MSEVAAQRNLVIGLAIGVEGGMIVLAEVLGRFFGHPPLRTLSWDGRDALHGVAAALPMLLLFFVVVRWPVGPLGRIKKFSEQVLCPLLAPCSVIDLIGISILAGLGEEMLFRAVFQGVFASWLSPWAGLILASVLFGLLHAVTAGYAVMATLMGAYLGWLWTSTGNLLTPVVTHALYDMVALLFLLRGPGSTERLMAALQDKEDKPTISEENNEN
jgi:hypothetical protein